MIIFFYVGVGKWCVLFIIMRLNKLLGSVFIYYCVLFVSCFLERNFWILDIIIFLYCRKLGCVSCWVFLIIIFCGRVCIRFFFGIIFFWKRNVFFLFFLISIFFLSCLVIFKFGVSIRIGFLKWWWGVLEGKYFVGGVGRFECFRK